MNENNKPVSYEASVITSVSESSSTNDCIDLTEINDCEETFEVPTVVSKSSVSLQHPSKCKRNRLTNFNTSEKNSSSVESESLDDSICILYEKVQPPPEVVVVNEVIIESREQNQSADIGITDNQTGTAQYANFPLQLSCHYSNAVNEGNCIASRLRELPRPPLPLSGKSLNLKRIACKTQSPGTELENSNLEFKAPKIQCGICMDGPDEIAASSRNFTSTNCGHVFCNVCIKTSMRNAAKCPKCRKKINSRSIHPLYL